jgi:hypothetical protein
VRLLSSAYAAAGYAVTVELADVQAEFTAHKELTRLPRQLNSRQQNPLLRLGTEATDWGIASCCVRWRVATLPFVSTQRSH